MRKNLRVLLYLLLVVFSCSSCGSNGDVKKEEIINYTGNYIAEDESMLSIMDTNGEYKVSIDIIRLTSIHDGVGISNEEKMLFEATDAVGNPIGGEVCWKSADEVVLEFTDSTWDYLPNGTRIFFERVSEGEYTVEEDTFEDDAYYENNYNESDLPYADVSSVYLGTSYTNFKAKGYVRYEIPLQNDMLPFIDEYSAEYITVDDKVYVGVQNDTIVGFVQYGYPAHYLVNDWIQNDEYYNSPPAIIAKDHRVILGWEIKNGYLIISAIPTNEDGQWYKYRPEWIMSVDSLTYCNNIEW